MNSISYISAVITCILFWFIYIKYAIKHGDKIDAVLHNLKKALVWAAGMVAVSVVGTFLYIRISRAKLITSKVLQSVFLGSGCMLLYLLLICAFAFTFLGIKYWLRVKHPYW